MRMRFFTSMVIGFASLFPAPGCVIKWIREFLHPAHPDARVQRQVCLADTDGACLVESWLLRLRTSFSLRYTSLGVAENVPKPYKYLIESRQVVHIGQNFGTLSEFVHIESPQVTAAQSGAEERFSPNLHGWRPGIETAPALRSDCCDFDEGGKYRL